MIALTRFNGSRLYVNSDLVQWVEEAPDAVLTLVTGEKIVVKESVPDVLRLLAEARRSVPRAEAIVAVRAAERAAALADGD